MSRRIARHDFDAERGELVAHRRIHILVGPGDVQPARFQHAGQAAHADAANRDQVNAPDFGDVDFAHASNSVITAS